jgi:hypothetical protein|tara:strand:+ start:289 stop:495 length:207 start_codon:yes stop_codon:yes gene_type:complete
MNQEIHMNTFYKKTFTLPVSQVNLTTIGGLLCIEDEDSPIQFGEADYRRLETGFSPMSKRELQDLLDS